MRVRSWLTVALLVLPAFPAIAQTPRTVIQAAPVSSSPAVELPDGSGAWVVEVVTSGGIMGGARRAVLTSLGTRICGSCDGKVPALSLTTIADSVLAAASAGWPPTGAVSPASLCQDCLITEMTLWRRAEDGTVSTFRARWDPTTTNTVAVAVRELHQHVLSALQR